MKHIKHKHRSSPVVIIIRVHESSGGNGYKYHAKLFERGDIAEEWITGLKSIVSQEYKGYMPAADMKEAAEHYSTVHGLFDKINSACLVGDRKKQQEKLAEKLAYEHELEGLLVKSD